jgi:hypothetical protein
MTRVRDLERDWKRVGWCAVVLALASVGLFVAGVVTEHLLITASGALLFAENAVTWQTARMSAGLERRRVARLRDE